MHKGWRACLAVSIDSFTSLASSPAVFRQKVNCTSESPSPAVCTFNSQASCGFFCHCSHVIVFRIKWPLRSGWSLCQKNTILRLIDVLRTGAGKLAFFDSKSARIARTPCTRPRPGKPNRGLSQCKRTCGHGNSGSVCQCGLRGGWSLATFWSQKKMGTETVLWKEKNDCYIWCCWRENRSGYEIRKRA